MNLTRVEPVVPVCPPVNWVKRPVPQAQLVNSHQGRIDVLA